MTDFNRPDIISNRENTAVFVRDIVVPMTYNLMLRQRTLGNMKMWPWKSKISRSLTTYLYAP
jgi:hypothetical protein